MPLVLNEIQTRYLELVVTLFVKNNTGERNNYDCSS